MGWGGAHIVVGDSERKTVLLSYDSNVPNGSKQMRLGSRTYISAFDERRRGVGPGR